MPKDYQAKATLNPSHASISYDTSAPVELDEDDWTALSNDIAQSFIASLAQMQDILDSAEQARRIYEMDVSGKKDWPWEGASNVDVPVVPTLVDTMVSQVAGMALPPRLIIVTGRTPEATKNAPLVERYLNDQMVEQRGHTTWYNEFVKWLEVGVQQGNGYVAATWREEIRRNKVRTEQLKMDETGTPIINTATMEPETEFVVNEVEETLYDDVDVRAIQLKDFLLVPPTARSLEAAVGSFETMWLMEDDLNKLVAQGILDADEVEAALSYVPNGNDEVAQDRQGHGDKSAGGQVSAGIGQGSMTSRFFKNRGPIKVELYLTKQFDMNGDGLVEWNWFWYHDLNQRMLGWTPYEYMVPGVSDSSKPYFSFAPLPRVLEHYGFMLPIRLAPIRAEIDNIHNASNNIIDLALSPMYTVLEGAVIEPGDQQVFPGKHIAVDNHDAFKLIETPQIPVAVFQREGQLEQYAQAYAGVSQQATGVQGAGRRTATDTKAQAAGNAQRANLIAMRFRIELRALVNFIHKMKVQYMKSDGSITINGEDFAVPREILGLPYRIDIVGASDPSDGATRRQEVLALYQLLMQNPLVQQSPQKIYAITRMVLEAFNEGDATELIGTEQEAQQMEQQMQQAKAAMAQQAAAGGAPPGAPQGNGKPQGAPQR